MRAVPDVNGPLTITGQPALSAEDQIIQVVLGGGTLRQLSNRGLVFIHNWFLQLCLSPAMGKWRERGYTYQYMRDLGGYVSVFVHPVEGNHGEKKRYFLT